MDERITQSVWLPFPPSANNLFAHGAVMGRHGKPVTRRFVSKRYREWRRHAELLIVGARLRPVVGAEAAVTIAITPPDKRRRDRDNYRKAILDALVRCHVLPDDHIVDSAPVEWCRAHAVGAVVTISALCADRPVPHPPPRRANTMTDEMLMDIIRAVGTIPLANGKPVLLGALRGREQRIKRLRDQGLLVEGGDMLFDGAESQTLIPR